MAVKWIGTKFKGVRYYEHPTRKHGLKKDHYLAIRYQINGKRIEEGVGWTSERDPEDNQYWTEAKAALVLERLRGAAKYGKMEAPTRIAEKRELEEKRKEAEAAELKRLKRENIILNKYFYNSYYPDAKINKKENSYIHEETHFRLWIDPIAGQKPLKELSEFDVRRIVKKLLDAGKSPRTIQYVMATLRQVWNKARRGKIVSGDSPTKDVKIPKFDNRRQRFLSHTEADLLLETLKEKNEAIYKMTLLSLHTGMRASEIFKLTWSCVDTERGIIAILDAKSGHGRAAFMTEQIKEMFNGMKRGKNDDFVFLRKDKKPYKEIPPLFRDVIMNLKFNENVSDTRQKVCFHTLRHTMASWHAEGGTDLYILKELLGHGSITLTERYSHLSNGALQEAARSFEKKIKAASSKGSEVINFDK
ncbi:MAG: tyrosine-type recombinase/integrase [Smithella sp.]